MPNKRWKTEQVSIDCSIHPVWTHLSSEHWQRLFKILSSVNREIKMRFSAHTNRKISIGQTQFAFDGENASSISSWSFLINLRTSEKAKLFEHFYPFSWILSRWHWWCCSSRGNPGSPQTSTFPLETKRCQINFLRSAMTKFPRILNWIRLLFLLCKSLISKLGIINWETFCFCHKSRAKHFAFHKRRKKVYDGLYLVICFSLDWQINCKTPQIFSIYPNNEK